MNKAMGNRSVHIVGTHRYLRVSARKNDSCVLCQLFPSVPVCSTSFRPQ
jgi:hypothetical protein